MKLYNPLVFMLATIFLLNTGAIILINYYFLIENSFKELLFLVVFIINGSATIIFSFIVCKKYNSAIINKLITVISSIEAGHLSLRVNCDELDNEELILVAHGINRMAGALQIRTNQLNNMALFDALTHIHNRHFFVGRAEKELIMAREYDYRVAILMIDIDFFKKINDEYGHQKGDIVLKTVASLLKDSIRHIDILARYGGEEFIILLPKADIIVAEAVASRSLKAVSAYQFHSFTDNFRVTVSIGLTLWHRGLPSLDSLIAVADKALYLAKDSGRNCIKVLIQQ